jgi:hypothetical protein
VVRFSNRLAGEQEHGAPALDAIERIIWECTAMKNTLGPRLILLGLWGILTGFVLSAPAASGMQVEGPARKKSAQSARTAPNENRYGSDNTKGWFLDALRWDGSPIDLSFLNEKERPAGRHGPLKADRDQLVFEDGTPVRFWGSNLNASALFSTPRENVARQAHRMAQLGYNMMRIHQHDAPWAQPNIFRAKSDTRHLNPRSVESIDWWIKCLKDEGIYVWLDLIYNRTLTKSDGVRNGLNEILDPKRNQGVGTVWGFNYVNPDLMDLMKEFQHQYLNHVNPYTKFAYKDDPAVLGVLITNENDLTFHFGNSLLPATRNKVHSEIYMREAGKFAEQTGLPAAKVWQSWLPGPSKIFLNDLEHRFNRSMIDDLRLMGLRTPVATTNYWAGCSQFSLPALAEGDVIDVHSYGSSEALSKSARTEPNFISWIGAAQVHGKPLTVSEWTIAYPEVDRFTAPLYMASIASLQGWDIPMHFNYSHMPIQAPGQIAKWESYHDPALCGVMPAAAVAFRQGHISPARTTYCLMLTREQLFDRTIDCKTSATIRTLVEQSRLTIGLPAVKELPWLEATGTPKNATVITDPDHDFIPAGQDFVKSDTGELLRNWKYGIQTINSPRTQAVSGSIGGKMLKLGAATFLFDNPKAVVALTSLDDQPLSKSRYILITAMARAIPRTPEHVPYFTEPVVGTITLKTETSDLQLLALGAKGTVVERLNLQTGPDGVTIRLPTRRGTHWYALKAPAQPAHGRI